MIRRPPRSTQSRSSAASDVYKRQRESLAREIHDSVLQALALVHKKGRELAQSPAVPPAEVAHLADIAGRQEVELRSLILRQPQHVATGRSSLRDALESQARTIDSPPVTVSAVGALALDSHVVTELAAATRQALENAARHADDTRVTVFAEEDNGFVVVSVTDDGRGFDYDEVRLEAEGKVGMLKSMKGRVVDLGGTMKVVNAPTGGTEIEFRVPLDEKS